MKEIHSRIGCSQDTGVNHTLVSAHIILSGLALLKGPETAHRVLEGMSPEVARLYGQPYTSQNLVFYR